MTRENHQGAWRTGGGGAWAPLLCLPEWVWVSIGGMIVLAGLGLGRWTSPGPESLTLERRLEFARAHVEVLERAIEARRQRELARREREEAWARLTEAKREREEARRERDEARREREEARGRVEELERELDAARGG